MLWSFRYWYAVSRRSGAGVLRAAWRGVQSAAWGAAPRTRADMQAARRRAGLG